MVGCDFHCCKKVKINDVPPGYASWGSLRTSSVLNVYYDVAFEALTNFSCLKVGSA